ncbi:MAG: hypothetical protein PHR14_08815 [Oscillospiraceae bacterium]|nr:hypothetical protein [Oscillospiraceae bacterium]
MKLAYWLNWTHDIETAFKMGQKSFDEMIEDLEKIKNLSYTDKIDFDAADYDVICTIVRFAKYQKN